MRLEEGEFEQMKERSCGEGQETIERNCSRTAVRARLVHSFVVPAMPKDQFLGIKNGKMLTTNAKFLLYVLGSHEPRLSQSIYQ